jgi:hypothetical protein
LTDPFNVHLDGGAPEGAMSSPAMKTASHRAPKRSAEARRPPTAK